MPNVSPSRVLPAALARLRGTRVAIDVSTTPPAELWPRIWAALQAGPPPVAWVRCQEQLAAPRADGLHILTRGEIRQAIDRVVLLYPSVPGTDG